MTPVESEMFVRKLNAFARYLHKSSMILLTLGACVGVLLVTEILFWHASKAMELALGIACGGSLLIAIIMQLVCINALLRIWIVRSENAEK